MFDYVVSEAFYATSENRMRIYFHTSKLHRVYGPAERVWNEKGQPRREDWYIRGVGHREYGPTRRIWYGTGEQMREEWRQGGKLHRLAASAVLMWGVDGTLEHQWYWLYGVEITEEIREWSSRIGITDIMNMTPEETTWFKLTVG